MPIEKSGLTSTATGLLGAGVAVAVDFAGVAVAVGFAGVAVAVAFPGVLVRDGVAEAVGLAELGA